MTREEAVTILNAMTDTDHEKTHIEADKILLIMLRNCQLDDVADAYERAEVRAVFYHI